MSSRQSQAFALLSIWLGAFCLHALFLTGLALVQSIFPEELPDYLLELTAVHAPYLTPIFGFWFLARQRAHPARVWTFRVSIIGVVLFNAVLTLALALVLLPGDRSNAVGEAITNMRRLGAALTFLVGPVIGFFFADDGDEATPSSARRS